MSHGLLNPVSAIDLCPAMPLSNVMLRSAGKCGNMREEEYTYFTVCSCDCDVGSKRLDQLHLFHCPSSPVCFVRVALVEMSPNVRRVLRLEHTYPLTHSSNLPITPVSVRLVPSGRSDALIPLEASPSLPFRERRFKEITVHSDSLRLTPPHSPVQLPPKPWFCCNLIHYPTLNGDHSIQDIHRVAIQPNFRTCGIHSIYLQ